MSERQFINANGHLGVLVSSRRYENDRRVICAEVPDEVMERWSDASRAKTDMEIEILFRRMTAEQREAWFRAIQPTSSGSPWIALRYHLVGAWNELRRLAEGTIDDAGRRHRFGWFTRMVA